MNLNTPDTAMLWLTAFRRRILNFILAIVVLLGTVGVVITVYQHILLGRSSLLLVYYVSGYILALILFFGQKIPDHYRAFGFLALVYIFTVFTFITGWLGGGGRQFLLALIVLTATLLGRRASLITIGLSLLTYAIFGYIFNRGWLVYEHAPTFANPIVIVIEGIGFAMAVAMIGTGIRFYREGLAAASRAIERSRTAQQLLSKRADELDNANKLLGERTRSLEIANQELETFSYSVSHDLRAPLRAIDGYSSILREDYGSRLDEEGMTYLENVIKSSKRMGMIIDDLLKLSQITRAELNRHPISISSLVLETTANLQKQDPTRQVQFQVQNGLTANGDPNLVRIVLDNLLGNAWKFTGKIPAAEIEFGAQQQDGKTIYFVRDNGAGFDMAHADKLFLSFQRLHSGEEFEGTGIGLAIVKRIIERHDGEIWFEAGVDQGATFYFTLNHS